MRSLSYTLLYALAIVVLLTSTLVTLVQAADPASLGFSPLAARWLGIGSGLLGVVASLLPRVNKRPDSSRRGMD